MLIFVLDFELAHWDHCSADFVLAWRGRYDEVIHAYAAVAPLEPEEWALLTPLWWVYLIEGACQAICSGTPDDRLDAEADFAALTADGRGCGGVSVSGQPDDAHGVADRYSPPHPICPCLVLITDTDWQTTTTRRLISEPQPLIPALKSR